MADFDFEHWDDLALTVEGRNGVLKRWGPDECNGQDVPQSLSFGTTIPNGFGQLTSSLLRRIDLDYPDMQLLGDVNVYGPGGEIVWQGRHTQFPRQHGDDFNITPSAVGWASHLLDDPQFSEIYVDADITKWGDMPLNEKIRIATVNDGGVMSFSTGGGGLMCLVPSQAVAAGIVTIAEAWYTAPVGCTIAKVMYIGGKTGTAPTEAKAFSNSTDSLASAASLTPTLDGTLRTLTWTTAARYNALDVAYAGAVTPALGTEIQYLRLSAFGSHGLTTRAIDTANPDGLYVSDIVTDLVSRAAPLLSTADITTNTVIVPHFLVEQSTAADALLAVNNYAQWDWGVYNNKRFFFRASDPARLTWTVRLSEGAGLELEGEQSDDAYNGVIVRFTDTTGVPRVYGPTGANADYTDSTLLDTSTTNVVNQAGIPRKWYPMDVPGVTTPAGALVIGQAKLAELALPQRRGTVTVKGFAHHPTAGIRPAWAIRAGDFVRVEDHPADVARKIVETSYDHSSRVNTLSVGQPSHKVDALLEGMQAAIVGLGSG